MARALFVFAALLLAACGGEQTPATPASRVALWEVSDSSGPRAWIFGTVHALPDGTEWERPALAEAMAKSDRLVLEIGTDLTPQIAGEALNKVAMTPGLPPVSARVAPARRAELARVYKRLGLGDENFANEETWAVALQIAAIDGEKDGISARHGVEPQLRRLAAGKPVSGLETIESQFAVFDRMTAREQEVLLDQTLAEISSPEDEERTLLALWLKGDDLGIASESSKGFLANPGLRDALLTSRNADWVRQIDAMLKRGARPFIAVGAAHVSGRDGLPALLAAKGWTIKRIP